jgi:hypothetical protein
VLIALGPLRLEHEDLWQKTWGQIEDLIQAWRYREYLESRNRAQLATWLLNGSGNLKHPIGVEDLVGHWVDGKVMSKARYRKYSKERVTKARGENDG